MNEQATDEKVAECVPEVDETADVTIPASLFRDMHAAYIRERELEAELKALRMRVAYAVACLTATPMQDRESDGSSC